MSFKDFLQNELNEAKTSYIFDKGNGMAVEVNKEGKLWAVIANGTEVFSSKNLKVAKKFGKDYKFDKNPNAYKDVIKRAEYVLGELDDAPLSKRLKDLIKQMKASKSKEVIKLAVDLLGDLQDHVEEENPDIESEVNDLYDALEDLGVL